MTDFNLIPEDYLRFLDWRANVVRSLLSLGAIICVSLAVAGGLHVIVANKEGAIETLQNKRQISQQQRNEITSLTAERDKLQAYLDFLLGLRGGAAAPDMFLSIDRALLGGDIWFQSWDFQRAGFAVQAEEAKRSNGYFIVAPGKDASSTQETWKIETHMNLRGQATDHAALSRFVARLHQQSEVNDVRILRTTLVPNAGVVDFNLIVTVDNSLGAQS